MEYKSKIDGDVEKDKVKLTMDFSDNTKRTKYVPSFDGSKGIEHLMFVEERFRKAAEKLLLENEELFEYFNEILLGNAQMEWDLLEQTIPEAEKTTDRFWSTIQNQFYRKYCSSDARDVMFEYLASKCRKPVGMEPRDHANRMQILYRYSNKLPGLEPPKSVEQQKLLIFRTYPESWRRDYIRAGQKVENDTLQDIVDFMTNEKGFADAEHGDKKNKNKREPTHNLENTDRKRQGNGRHNFRGNHARGRQQKRIVGSNDPCPHHFGNHTWGQCFDNPDGINFRPRNTNGNHGNNRGMGRNGRFGRGNGGRGGGAGRGNGALNQQNAQQNVQNNFNYNRNNGSNGYQNYHNEAMNEQTNANSRGQNHNGNRIARANERYEQHHLEMVGQGNWGQTGIEWQE